MTTIKLPPLSKHDHPEPQTHVWTALEMSAIRARALAEHNLGASDDQ